MTEIGKNYVTPENEGKAGIVHMSVYSALNKRKIYASRLEKFRSAELVFLGMRRQSDVDVAGMSLEEFENSVKSHYDVYVATLRNFYELNAAITQSNALTRLTIAGVEYTVAEAIVRYDRIQDEIKFLSSISKQVKNSRARISCNNTEELSEEKVNEYINEMTKFINLEGVENADEVLSNIQEKHRQDYINRNTYLLVDPYNHAETIDEKIERLNEFASEFNESLNVCNMSTFIEVNLIN